MTAINFNSNNGWLIDRVKTHAAEMLYGIGTL